MLVKSLPVRFIWMTSLLVLLSLAVLTYAGFSCFDETFHKSISSYQATMMSALAREIDDELSLDVRLLEHVAQDLSAKLMGRLNLALSVPEHESELLEIFKDGLLRLDAEGKVLAGSIPHFFVLASNYQALLWNSPCEELALLLQTKKLQLSVLYMSGYGEHLLEESDVQAGLLPKPFAPDAFLSEVRKSLTRTI